MSIWHNVTSICHNVLGTRSMSWVLFLQDGSLIIGLHSLSERKADVTIGKQMLPWWQTLPVSSSIREMTNVNNYWMSLILTCARCVYDFVIVLWHYSWIIATLILVILWIFFIILHIYFTFFCSKHCTVFSWISTLFLKYYFILIMTFFPQNTDLIFHI